MLKPSGNTMRLSTMGDRFRAALKDARSSAIGSACLTAKWKYPTRIFPELLYASVGCVHRRAHGTTQRFSSVLCQRSEPCSGAVPFFWAGAFLKLSAGE